MTMTDVYLGRIVKAFGIRGELKFHPSDDFWEDVLSSKQLTMNVSSDDKVTERPVVFEQSRPHGKNYVVKMDGVKDRTAAEAMVGAEVFIADDRIDVELPERLLPYQLLGMGAKTETGELLGEISSIVYSSAHDIWEITGPKGSFLVPAIPEFIVSVDESARTIIVRPVPGLIEE